MATTTEQKQVEIEWRVVGRNERGPWRTSPGPDEDAARRALERLTGGRNRDVHLERRQVTYEPWEDVADE